MNTQVIPFQFDTHQLRALVDEQGNPWFIAQDVAAILGYSDTFKMTKRLDTDEIQNRQIGGFGNRGVNIINESGLYSSILGSKKPEAKAFKKKVTAEILPSIRKTGGYAIEQTVPMLDYIALQTKLISAQDRLLSLPPPVIFGQPRPFTAEEKQTAVTMRLEGQGYTRIGFKLGRGTGSVKYFFEKEGNALMAQRQHATQNDLFGGV